MNNTEENSHQHKSKLNLHICGGEHKVSTLEEVQEVTTPEVEYRKEKESGWFFISFLSSYRA